MKWWKITNQSNQEAELLLYGSIGDDWFAENNSKDFAQALQGLRKEKNITIRINSPGGDVTAAQAIYTLLKSHSAYITVRIDGLAASAAGLIAMAGDKVIMPLNALFMLHNPMSYMAGEKEDFLLAADVLEKVKETMITVYAGKTGKDKNTISQMMDTETWLTAEEALVEGFIDEIDRMTAVSIAAGREQDLYSINGLPVDLKGYKNVPVAALYAGASPQSNTNKNQEGKSMNAEKIKAEYPTVYTEIYNAGAAAERNRIKEIDSIQATGYEPIKSKAKYESFEPAGKVAIEILNAQAARTANIAAGRADDVFTSNVNHIPVGNAPEQEKATEQDLIQKAIAAANANVKGRE